jgi:transposase-like protein
MQIKLHANATTTPRTRSYIQTSTATVAELVEELGINETTVRRWKNRTTVEDKSHRPDNIQTNFSPEEEAIIVELRITVGLSLDDITEVMKRCVMPSASRSAVHRCLVRHGISKKPKEPKGASVGTFEEAKVGFIHIDLKHLTKLQGKPAFVFVAIDRATRFVHIEITTRRDADTIAACVERFLAIFPHPVKVILTDNGAEFTDRFSGARWKKFPKPSGNHAFDRLCAAHGIDHRLTKTFSPQTNGMVERFNRRIAEAIAARTSVAKNEGKNKFLTHEDRNAFLNDVVFNYNRTRLRCLNYKAPLELLSNLPGHNTFAAIHGTGSLLGVNAYEQTRRNFKFNLQYQIVDTSVDGRVRGHDENRGH